MPPAQVRPRLYVEPFASHHDRAAFSCGVKALDTYIKQGAGQDESRNLTRTFVLTSSRGNPEVRGYYTLSNYAIQIDALPEQLRKRLPGRIPLPATLLGRLAVDMRYQKQGLGKSLLLYALREALRASRVSASLGVVVDAMTDELVPFYQSVGFVRLVDRERHLIIPITRLAQLFPKEAPPSLSVEALLQQLQTTAEMATSLDTSALDEEVAAALEDLQRRLHGLLSQ